MGLGNPEAHISSGIHQVIILTLYIICTLYTLYKHYIYYLYIYIFGGGGQIYSLYLGHIKKKISFLTSRLVAVLKDDIFMAMAATDIFKVYSNILGIRGLQCNSS